MARAYVQALLFCDEVRGEPGGETTYVRSFSDIREVVGGDQFPFVWVLRIVAPEPGDYAVETRLIRPGDTPQIRRQVAHIQEPWGAEVFGGEMAIATQPATLLVEVYIDGELASVAPLRMHAHHRAN